MPSPQKILTVEKPTQKEFNLFSELVLNDLGLEWGDGKKYLLHARVQRRLQILKIQTFEEYYNFIEKDENNSERQYLYNAVTTTKSGFYREKQKNKKDELINEVKNLEIYKKVMEKFPDAELVDVKLNEKKEDKND